MLVGKDSRFPPVSVQTSSRSQARVWPLDFQWANRDSWLCSTVNLMCCIVDCIYLPPVRYMQLKGMVAVVYSTILESSSDILLKNTMLICLIVVKC